MMVTAKNLGDMICTEAFEQGFEQRERLGCAFNRTRGVILATDLKTVRTLDERRLGLLNRDTFPVGHALHIVPCDSIHTVGMRFSIDVAFLDENGIVLATFSDVQPGRAGIGCYRAASCLELPVCVLEATRTYPGDVLEFQEVAC